MSDFCKEYEFKSVEERWQKLWAEARIFEAEPRWGKPKVFITVPYPYPNTLPHLGHALTYTRADVWARFKRAQGFNVLLPQAFHFTGEPLLGAVERVKKGDPVQTAVFKEAGLPAELWKDALAIARFFMQEWIKDLKALGMSIDWRRTFHTTSHEPSYDAFVRWQYERLRELGCVSKGTHPVVWCPSCLSPTGDHARLEGEGVGIVEYVLLKFNLSDALLVAATLRPETVYGVTNIWINPRAKYVKARVNGELWMVSSAAVQKLRDQLKEVEVLEEFEGSKLVGQRCFNPVLQRWVLVLPASFVDADNATGVVMSVPAHAPLDWLALQAVKQDAVLQEFGLRKEEVQSIEPMSLIEVPTFGEFPAVEVCREFKLSDQLDPRVAKATELVYKKEFYEGVLKPCTGRWAGKRVCEVKSKLIKWLERKRVADRMWETADRVVCRCWTRCHVKVLQGQWFLTYSSKRWKRKVLRALEVVEVWPEEARHALRYTIEAMEDKACARRAGLGTCLPWDPEWVVESLSDSTIYPAFYTIAHRIKNFQCLSKEVFDYIFLGKGKPEQIVPELAKELESMRREFLYWYPVDLRNSGKDLLYNHLAFYLYHHAALFPAKHWPRAISVNGWLCIEGQKMSKSKGIYISLRQALAEWGADVTRLNLILSATGISDADWRRGNALALQRKLKVLFGLVQRAEDEGNELSRWLWSKMQHRIKRVTECLERMETGTAAQEALYGVWEDVKWFRLRTQHNPSKSFFKAWITLLSPFVPHFAEEAWKELGEQGFVALNSWPQFKAELIDSRLEQLEEEVKGVLEDLKHLVRLVGKKEKLFFYASDAKELEHLSKASEFFKQQLGFKAVKAWLSSDESRYDPLNKAQKARPGKPAIYLE